jgi:3'-phosphoadenosine 5'-phosphosulfate sulfotransferase (PAPS reductase)/FAD synthetase
VIDATPIYVISASYGNDSMAMIQWASEAGLDLVGRVIVAYCDTGWADPSWAARIDAGEAFAARLGFEVARLTSIGMEELVRMKKGFPGNGQQFCTMHLKGVPFLDWIDQFDTDRCAIVMVGKRRVESLARSETPEFIDESEYHGDRKLWHPLYLHTDDDRDGLLQRAGFEVLPHRSMECNPCVNANRGDFLNLSAGEIAKVSALEVAVGRPMFRPKRFNAVGIFGVIAWAKFGKNHSEDVPEDSGCGAPFGCGL